MLIKRRKRRVDVRRPGLPWDLAARGPGHR